MRDEYNIRELNPSKNPYTSKVKVTIDVEGSTLDYFKSMAAADGIPYQTLITLYLRDCADNRRKFKCLGSNEKAEEQRVLPLFYIAIYLQI